MRARRSIGGRPSFETPPSAAPQDEAVLEISRCQTAQCSSFPRRVAAPGFVRLRRICFRFRSEPAEFPGQRQPRQQQSRPPKEGWMERRQAHSSSIVARAKRDHRVPVRPGPLSALHRGDFRRGPTLLAPGSGTPEPQRLPAPAVDAWRSGYGPPALRFRAAVAGRHSWLRL
jgi:hypothetical protein